jgi:hypothetical protein
MSLLIEDNEMTTFPGKGVDDGVVVEAMRVGVGEELDVDGGVAV